MFSKKKGKEEKIVATSSQTRRVTQTSTTTTTRTIVQQQLISSSTSSLGSNTPLPIRPLTDIDVSRPISTISNDARPFIPNYQTPYQRNSSVYSSLQPRTRNLSESSTKYVPPLAATTVSSSLPATKQLTVKKTGKLYDNNPVVPTYSTHSKNRGEVLLINNIMFKNHSERHGAKEDDKNLTTVFKQIGFNVTVERDLKTINMTSKIKKFSEKSSLKSADIAIVVVMSHGTKSTCVGGTEVFGVDEKPILIDDLIEIFNDSSCKYMVAKPKIFIFQCCRGDNEQFVQKDAQLPPRKTALTDALIAYSTLPGFVSHRDVNTGTWYIRTLCEVFSQHAHEYHVEDLLKMVDVQINQLNSIKQTTHYENRGFKRCYLHPV